MVLKSTSGITRRRRKRRRRRRRIEIEKRKSVATTTEHTDSVTYCSECEKKNGGQKYSVPVVY